MARNFFRLVLSAGFWWVSLTVQAASKPNFLLFMADDMSYHDLGCIGNSDVQTPNLDQFATQGTVFPRTYTAAPTCAPTRMSLYTGIHPVRNGGHPNHSAVYPGIRSLPQYLDELGYRVAILGKRHERPLAQFPFQQLGGRHHDDGTGLDLDTDLAGTFIAENKAEPWCLVVTSNQPHTPWNRGDAARYDPAKLRVPPYLVDTPETREGLASYYAEITYMDAQFGRVMAHLEASGEADDTLVVFLTEQGSNFPFCKWTCYEMGLRATAITRWPGRIASGRRNDALIQYVDIPPTFVELAGGNPASMDFDGRSLAAVFTTPDAPSPHQFIFGMNTTRGIARGSEAYAIRTVRDERYRLIWNLNFNAAFKNTVTHNFEPYLSWKPLVETDAFAAQRYAGYQHRPEFELYDLETDPWELHNLVDDPALQSRRTDLTAALKRWMVQQGDQGIATEMAAFDRIPDRDPK